MGRRNRHYSNRGHQNRNARLNDGAPHRGPVVGAVLVGTDPDDGDCQMWMLTKNADALELPESEVVFADDWAEAKATLNRRNPAPAGMTRVFGGEKLEAQVLVYPHAPINNLRKDYGAAFSYSYNSDRETQLACVAEIESRVADGDRVMLNSEDYETISKWGSYFDCELVANRIPGWAILRLDPGKSRARRSRAENMRKKEKVKAERQAKDLAAEEEAKTRQADLAAVLDPLDYHAETLLEAVKAKLPRCDALSPESEYGWGNGVVLPIAAALHAALFGGFRYRLIPGYLAAMAAWRKVDRKYLAREIADLPSPHVAWLDAEAKACGRVRVPKPKELVTVPEEALCAAGA